MWFWHWTMPGIVVKLLKVWYVVFKPFDQVVQPKWCPIGCCQTTRNWFGVERWGGRRKWRIKVCSIYQPTSQGAANHQRPGVNEAASALGHGGWGGGGGVNCHPYQRAYGPHIPAHIRPGPLVRDKWGGSNWIRPEGFRIHTLVT